MIKQLWYINKHYHVINYLHYKWALSLKLWGFHAHFDGSSAACLHHQICMYVSKSTGIKDVESIAPKSVTKNQWLNNYGLPIRICLQQNLNKWEFKINYLTTIIGENRHLFNRCGTGTSVAQHQCPLNRCLNLSCPLMLKEGITPIYHP